MKISDVFKLALDHNVIIKIEPLTFSDSTYIKLVIQQDDYNVAEMISLEELANDGVIFYIVESMLYRLEKFKPKYKKEKNNETLSYSMPD